MAAEYLLGMTPINYQLLSAADDPIQKFSMLNWVNTLVNKCLPIINANNKLFVRIGCPSFEIYGCRTFDIPKVARPYKKLGKQQGQRVIIGT